MTTQSETFRPRINDVAQLAGVSVSSASRALTGHPDVSRRMLERVKEAARQLGYQPDELAQGLRTGRSGTVGFVVGDISNPTLSPVVLAAEVELRSSGRTVIITNSELDPARDAEHIGLLRRRRAEGLLLSLSDDQFPATAAAVVDSGLPTVLIDRELKGAPECSAVLLNHEVGLEAAVRHTRQLGHTRIGLIMGRDTIRPNRERKRVLLRTAAHQGMTAVIADGGVSDVEVAAAAATLLDLVDPPTVLISSGQVLPGVLRALRHRHLAVPEDISLITCDDIPLAEFLDPPMATIERDLAEVGRAAARLLVDRLDGGSGQLVTVPTGFSPRASCAAPR